MFIKNNELYEMKCLWSLPYSRGYEINPGSIAKVFINLSPYHLLMKKRKIELATYYRDIPELAIPLEPLETEDSIGYIQDKKEGVPFSDYLKNARETVTLQEIIHYICTLERVVKICHHHCPSMVFPDIASHGNVLYNPKTKTVGIVDYDGNQISTIADTNISDYIYEPFYSLVTQSKYLKNNRFTSNIDILSLITLFLHYTTNSNLGTIYKENNNIDQFIHQLGLTGTQFADCIKLVLDPNGKNRYISESLEELDKQYILISNTSCGGRTFMKK